MAEPDEHWWRTTALQRCWSVIAIRLEQTGLQPSGKVTLGDLSLAERRAVSDLIGDTVLGDRARIDLVSLDERLRIRAGISLPDAAAQATDRTLVDRAARRAQLSARRANPIALADAWAADHPQFPQQVIHQWVQALARDGVLARDPDPEALVFNALVIIEQQDRELHGVRERSPDQATARTELAARVRGDAHCLDDGRRLAAVVLRLVALLVIDADGDAQASDLEAARLWERIGVVTDRVSSTCLTLGLLDAAGQPINGRGAGEPVHLTWRDLDKGLSFATGQLVLVCENPRVLEAAAELAIDGWAVLCTSGRPSLVTMEVLTQLRAADAIMRYHGDFDWPGIAIANDLIGRFGMHAWQMAASDYLNIPAQLPLAGSRVEAAWDAELAPAMAHRGLAVHEEATLPDLLLDLPRTL